jgi:hypothetical protein
VLMVAAAATVVVWLIRVPQILTADHGAPFKIVHLALGVVSVVLAALVWQVGVVASRSTRRADALVESRQG